jgi:hypothetical protein
MRQSVGGDPRVAELPVDVGGEGVGRDAAQPTDVDGFELAVGEQLVEQASSDAESVSGLWDGEKKPCPAASCGADLSPRWL